MRRRSEAGRLVSLRLERLEPRCVPSGLPAANAIALGPDAIEPAALQGPVVAFLEPAELLQRMGLDAAARHYGLDGAGQTVAIIDSGVAYTHTALGGGYGPGYRVVGGWDFTNGGDPDPYDAGPQGGHGTHVAGILASTDPCAPGLVPGADLVALRVFDDMGHIEVGWLEQALAWVDAHRYDFRYPITTVNLSLGGSSKQADTLLAAAIEDELALLRSHGVFVAVAAGNGFAQDAQPGVTYPASSPAAVPVTAVDDDGQVSYFSQRDSRAIAAPGRAILSTVPDSLGNRNGIDDDFARFSGTSMATPFVAGAAVLLRQACEFAGLGDVDPDSLYRLMYSTAEVVGDPTTGLAIHRLDLPKALQAVMPGDDYGSTAAAAHALGPLAERLSVRGTIGRLEDCDWFSFTAGASGCVRVELTGASHALRADWQLPGIRHRCSADGTVVEFDVAAGRTYTVGLGTAAGIGHYEMTLQLQPGASAFGAQAGWQQTWHVSQLAATGTWFAVEAVRDGTLTIDAAFAHAQGDVDLELFDAQHNLLAGSYCSGDAERIDAEILAGQTFYVHVYLSGAGTSGAVDVRATNMLSRQGRSVLVVGTPGPDQILVAAGATPSITVNGVTYALAATDVEQVIVDGLDGHDQTTLIGSAQPDRAQLRPGQAVLQSECYRLEARNVEQVLVFGGGGSDEAALYDSPGRDTLVAFPRKATLSGAGFSCQVEDFPVIHAYATAGGKDTATLYDSPGSDLLVATASYAKLTGAGYFLRAKCFDTVHARADQGGYDTARISGADKTTVFNGAGASAGLSGRRFALCTEGFERMTVRTASGSTSTARLSAVDYVLDLLGRWSKR